MLVVMYHVVMVMVCDSKGQLVMVDGLEIM